MAAGNPKIISTIYLFGNEAIYALVTAGGMMLLAAVAMLYVNDGKLIRVAR